MDALYGRVGGDAEFVAERHAQALVGAKRLCDVSAPLSNARNHIDKAHPERTDETDEQLLARAEKQSA